MASSLTVQIGNTAYQILSFSIKARINERSQFDVVAIDTTNVAVFPKGTKIVVSDTNLGTLFTGFINTAEPLHIIAQPYTYWQINCIDYHYVADKRTVTAAYTNQYAGFIALDMLQSTLAAEGVTSQYATQFTDVQTDWNKGTLSSTVATGNVEDGDIELIGSSSASGTFNSAAQWNTGTYSNTQNNGADVSLVQQWRNWNDGNKAGQTLYGNGSPVDGVSSGVYTLQCNALSETRSRLDFAGTWAAPFTYIFDVYVGGDIPAMSGTYLTTSWGNPDNGYAYAVELKTVSISLRRGANSSSGGSSTQIATHSFSPKLAVGWYTIQVQVTGTTHNIYLNGTLYLTVTDATYTAAGYLALRNRNLEPSTVIVMSFDNMGVASALSGSWTSPGTSLAGITTVASSSISWDTSLSTGGTITVQTSIDNGSTYQTATNGGAIPGLPKGTAGSGKTLKIQVTLSTTTPALAPDIKNLQWSVLGGYTSPGTRSTAPLVNDTAVRANQSGWSPSFDGQTITKVGTGTDDITNNEARISNTTGNCHEHFGSTTATDQDGTVNFQLSASTINGAMELRFTDANNFYQLVCSTTAISIIKMLAGTQTTLATAVVALSTGTFYTMRFRVAGSAPAVLQARVWAKGTLEPSVWAVTANDSGSSPVAFTLYGSNVPAVALSSAAKLTSGTGGTDTQGANNTPASAATGYMEISPLGGTQAINAALPATPSGKGWIWDVPTLEGQTINAGNWQFNVGIADVGFSGDTNVTLVWRVWKRLSGGTYASVGSITLTGQTVNTTRTNFVFGPSSLSSMGFVTGDKAYFELYAGNIAWTTGFFGQTYAVWVSSSGTAGINNDAMAGTPGYQSSGSGNIASGGFALMANGTGTTSFDHFRVTQYPDPALSLASVGRVGSTFITWNALLPTSTTLGMDLSPDGVNWTDVSTQNGGSIPFINSLQPPTLDYFNANTSSNYSSTFQGAATWYNTSYQYKKKITINHTKVSGGSDLSSFPVLISRTDADLKTVGNGGKVQNASGFDIIFIDSTETTKLDHEIENYVAATGEIEMWVRIPTLSASSDTIIYLYFGNSGISSSQENVTGVWDTNYKGVWHLSDNAANTTVKDSTSNANNGTNQANTNTKTATGQVAGGLTFNGSSDYVNLAHPASLDFTTTFTFEAWYKSSTATPPGYAGIFAKGQWRYGLDAHGTNAVDTWVNNASNQVGGTLTTSWTHVAWTMDTSHWYLYVNGSQITSASPVAVTSAPTEEVDIGRIPSGAAADYFSGIIDEVRASNSARTAGWIATEYSNQNSPGAFYSVGVLIGYATWTFDTANRRLVATGGTSAIYLNAAITWSDVDLLCDLDQTDAGGLVWRFVDASDFYLLTIADASSNVGTPNLLALYKVASNVATQLALAPITFPRGTYHRFRVTMLAGVITAMMDGITLISYTDSNPLAAGQVGMFQNGGAVGSRYYTFWCQPQGDYVGGTPFGDVVSAQFIYSRQRLATTDATVTPQVLDMTIGVTDPYIGLGTLLPQTAYASAYVSSNMDDLTNKSANYAWQIDQNGKLRFQVIQATPSPWVLDSRDSMVQKLRVIYEAPAYSNRQQLTGVVSTIAFSDTKIGDAKTRSFALSYPNAAAPTITLNTNPQSVGIKGIDTNKNWYWQYGDSTLYQDANGTVLVSTDTLAITGTGLTTTTVTRDSLSAQALLAALEGSGTGIVEAVTDVSQFGLTVPAAQTYGDQLNTRYANLGRTVKFETTRFGLAPGQLIPGFIAGRGIANMQLFITSVETIARAYSTARSGQIARVFGSTLPASGSHGAVGIRYVSLVECSETPYTGSWQKKLSVKKK